MWVQGPAGYVLLVAVAACVPASIASAATEGRLSADAVFESYDPTGCIDTEVAVFVRGAKVNADGSQSDRGKVHLVATVLNECEDVAILKAEGRRILKDREFSVRPDLTSAALNATVSMSINGSDEKFDAKVALTWTSIEGPIWADVKIVPEELGRFEKLSTSARRILHLAEASGRVSRDLQNFTPAPSTDGSISLVRPKSRSQ